MPAGCGPCIGLDDNQYPQVENSTVKQRMTAKKASLQLLLDALEWPVVSNSIGSCVVQWTDLNLKCVKKASA